LANGVFAFQHLDHHRAGGHELDEARKKRPFAVYGIKTLGLLARKPLHSGRDDLQAIRLKPFIDPADQIARHGIRFDDGKRALDCHDYLLDHMEKLRGL